MGLADLSDAQRSFLTSFLAVKMGNQDPAAAAWESLHKTLAPKVDAALKANHPEAGNIRTIWAFALEKADSGDPATAIKAGERLSGILAKDAPAAEVPRDVVAFQKSRIMWIGAKRDMKSGLDSFRSAVMKQAADDEDKAEIDAATNALLADFAAFDESLEDQLDAITQTAEGPDRTKLKKAADAAIQRYIKALDGPFLSMVDSNPFVSVNVAARGRQCLSAIRATLT